MLAYIHEQTIADRMDDLSKKSLIVWFMVFNATSTLFQLYRGGQFYWWRKLEYSEKTIDLSPQVTDKFYHIMLYRVHLAWVGFELTTLVVIGIYCTGSCKSNSQPEMMGTLLICISKMTTPGRLQFSYDLYRRYHFIHNCMRVIF